MTLWAPFGSYHLTTPGRAPVCAHDQPLHGALEFDDLEQAAAFVSRLMNDVTAAQWLRRLAADLGTTATGGSTTDEQVARDLAYLLWTRRLVLIECRPPLAPHVPEESEAPPPPPREASRREPVAEHWIEFKVVEETSQQFIENVSVELVLPNREEASYTTERNVLHIKLSQSGTARLLKLEHSDYWEAV